MASPDASKPVTPPPDMAVTPPMESEPAHPLNMPHDSSSSTSSSNESDLPQEYEPQTCLLKVDHFSQQEGKICGDTMSIGDFYWYSLFVLLHNISKDDHLLSTWT